MDHEFAMLSPAKNSTRTVCQVLDTLTLARQMHPGQKNNLDALCRRYGIDNSHRTLHGALLDAEILADVYLLMTGGQVALNLASMDSSNGEVNANDIRRLTTEREALKVITASADELTEHEARLDIIESKGASSLWRQ